MLIERSTHLFLLWILFKHEISGFVLSSEYHVAYSLITFLLLRSIINRGTNENNKLLILIEIVVVN